LMPSRLLQWAGASAARRKGAGSDSCSFFW
jgi:hypothetical protein